MIRWSIPAAVSPRVRRDQSLHRGRARAAAREARRAHLADAPPPDLGGLGGRAESQSPLRRPGTAAGLPLAAPDRRRPHARSRDLGRTYERRVIGFFDGTLGVSEPGS